MKNILVTGGCGFIGSRLVSALRKYHPNAIIWIYDNLHPQVHGSNPTLTFDEESTHFIKADITDSSMLQQVVSSAKPELVYHLAAETGTGQSYDEVVRYCEVNVLGTAYLIEALRKVSGVECKVILAGSRAVYGEGGYVDGIGQEFIGLPRTPESMRVGKFEVVLSDDAQPPWHPIPSHTGLSPKPTSIYASTKLMQEYLLTQAGYDSSIIATSLRFQNVYGPGQSLRNPYTGVLSIFCQQLLSGMTLEIYEDGNIARDFVFLDDAVSALVKAGIAYLPHGEIIDIGSGKSITILEVARIMARYLGCPDRDCHISGKFRVGDIRYALADISKAKRLLDWSPQIEIEMGLKQLTKWAENEYRSLN